MAQPDPDADERFADLDADEEDETTTQAFSLPREGVAERMPTQLDDAPEFAPVAEDEEDEETERSLPSARGREDVVTARDGRPRPRMVDEDGDTAIDEVAISLPDDDG